MNSIFNAGHCWFEGTGQEYHYSCIICGNQILSMENPRVANVMCRKSVTVSEALDIAGARLPAIVSRLGNFGVAVLQHLSCGAKTRSIEEIREIFHTYCKPPGEPCLYYSSGRCLACGCYVNDMSAGEWLNKIAWKEEHCTKGFW